MQTALVTLEPRLTASPRPKQVDAYATLAEALLNTPYSRPARLGERLQTQPWGWRQAPYTVECVAAEGGGTQWRKTS